MISRCQSATCLFYASALVHFCATILPVPLGTIHFFRSENIVNPMITNILNSANPQFALVLEIVGANKDFSC